MVQGFCVVGAVVDAGSLPIRRALGIWGSK